MSGRGFPAPDRKALGGLLLVVVLFVAAVLPNLTPKVVGGTAVAQFVPGPPQVGECVTTPLSSPVSASVLGTVSASALRYGPCDGGHYGEVVRVLPDPTDLSDGRLDEFSQQACGDAVVGYVGAGSLVPTRPEKLNTWSPVLFDGATIGVPDRIQRSAGQHWIACTLVPRTALDKGGYLGTSRDLLQSGLPTAAIGLCSGRAAVELDGGVACSRPHRYQILGEATANNASSTAGLTASCRSLAGALTHMPDITAGGRLQVAVTFLTWRASVGILTATAPMAVPEQQTVSCALGVVGSAQLNGSLLGLGTAPLPISG